MSDIAATLSCLMNRLFEVGRNLECMSTLLENGESPTSKGAPAVMRPGEHPVSFATVEAKSLRGETPMGTLNMVGAAGVLV